MGILLNKSDILSATVQNQVVVIGSAAEGEGILLDCRRSTSFMSVAGRPSWRAWEGPYLRISPSYAQSDYNRKVLRKVFSGVDGRISDATGGQFSLDGLDSFYEFDAIGCPLIELPFDASLSLVSNLAGTWAFDLLKFERSSNVNEEYPAFRHKGNNQRLYPQTRMVFGNGELATRLLTVPLGCVEIQPVGYQDTSNAIIFSVEDVGQLLAGSSSLMSAPNAAGIFAQGRLPIAGSRSVRIATGAAGQQSGVVFWCAL